MQSLCRGVRVSRRPSLLPRDPRVPLALLGAERAEELLIVVRVDPNATRGVGSCIDEELMALFGVKGAHPAGRELAELVLHGTPVLGGYAIAFCAMGGAVGANTADARRRCGGGACGGFVGWRGFIWWL
jgi:hypothetical protein